jgi:hypothetical protein
VSRVVNRVVKAAGVAGLCFASAVVAAGPAQASGGAAVSQTAASFTPYLTSSNSTVDQIVQCGSTMYAVGTFTQIGRPDGSRYSRTNAFSFSATTGSVTSWNPSVNGTVSGVALSSDCTKAYLGGTFTKVHGTAVTNLAEVSTSTGAVVSGFRPQPNRTVFTLALHGSHLIVGGSFTTIGGGSRTALASVSPTSGALSSYTSLAVSGTIAGDSGLTRVFKLRVSPNGSRVLALGNFSKVAGSGRQQAFIANFGTSSTSLDSWYSPLFSQSCASKEPYYVQAGAWSPDGSRVYFATTGDVGQSPLCDTASAFASSGGGALSPIWTNKTGCDSLFAVAADSSAVYVGGHERWANNEHGCDAAGTGSVARQGVGAMSVGTGRALAWNPTRGRGHGADDALRTSAGLWIASDNFFGSTQCAHAYHAGICFFPNG